MSDLDDEQFQPGGHGEDEMALPASITADVSLSRCDR